MKQIDVSKTRFRFLGVVFVVVNNTMMLFGVVMLMIALVGWHALVFSQYIPNLYVFLTMLVGLWGVLALFSYKVLLPVAFRFQNQQVWAHASPFREELEKIRDDIQELKTLMGGKT